MLDAHFWMIISKNGKNSESSTGNQRSRNGQRHKEWAELYQPTRCLCAPRIMRISPPWDHSMRTLIISNHLQPTSTENAPLQKKSEHAHNPSRQPEYARLTQTNHPCAETNIALTNFHLAAKELTPIPIAIRGAEHSSNVNSNSGESASRTHE